MLVPYPVLSCFQRMPRLWALKAHLFFPPTAHSLAGLTHRAAGKLIPRMTFLVQTPIHWALLGKGRDGGGVLVPSLSCCGFRFHFLVGESTDLRG